MWPFHVALLLALLNGIQIPNPVSFINASPLFPSDYIRINVRIKVLIHSPFLHYRLVSCLQKINIGKTGNQNPPNLKGGFWLPVFPILIFLKLGTSV